MAKKNSGRFFGAIQKNGYEVKVDYKREDVEKWFKDNHPLCRKFVWFQGFVDAGNDRVLSILSDENKDAELNLAQKNRVQIEITCFVSFFYSKKKMRVIPGAMKGAIAKFIDRIATKDK